MPCYSFLGLHIELPWRIERPESSAQPALEVRLGAPEQSEREPDADALAIRRVEKGLELRFKGLCRMVIPDGNTGVLHVIPAVGGDADEVKRQVLEHVIPRLLSRSHGLVLHASSVVLESGVVGFLAESGGGKSTLALAFARRGAAVLGDDSLVVDVVDGRAVAYPLWSNVRIHRSDLSKQLQSNPRVSRTTAGKAALHEGDDPTLRFARDAQPLRAIYMLDEAEHIEISSVTAREIVFGLLRQSYHLEFDDMGGLSQLVSRVEQLGLTRCTYQLAYPRDFGRLDALCESIVSHAASLP